MLARHRRGLPLYDKIRHQAQKIRHKNPFLTSLTSTFHALCDPL